jgi:hypothetical protein
VTFAEMFRINVEVRELECVREKCENIATGDHRLSMRKFQI